MSSRDCTHAIIIMERPVRGMNRGRRSGKAQGEPREAECRYKVAGVSANRGVVDL